MKVLHVAWDGSPSKGYTPKRITCPNELLQHVDDELD